MLKQSCVLWVCLVGSSASAIGEGNHEEAVYPFECRISVISAIENGPFVVQVTMTNAGEKVSSVSLSSRRSAIVFLNDVKEEPMIFRSNQLDQLPFGEAIRHLACGDTLSCSVAAHLWYPSIPAGMQSTTVCWSLYAPDEQPNAKRAVFRSSSDESLKNTSDEMERRRLVRFEKTIKVNVQPATSANILACVRKLESILNSPEISPEDLEIVLQHVLHQKNREFAPIAYRLLNHDSLKQWRLAISKTVLNDDCRDERSVLDAVQYLCGENPRAIDCVLRQLGRWKGEPGLLSPSNIEKLKKAPSVWVRTATYVLAPKRCDEEFVGRLLNDLKTLRTTVSESEIAPFLRDLDDDRYAKRVLAQKQLIQKGDIALTALRRELRSGRLSTEADTRARSIIHAIEIAPLDGVEDQMMGFLAEYINLKKEDSLSNEDRNSKKTCVQKVLEAIAANDASLRITNEAKRVLTFAKN